MTFWLCIGSNEQPQKQLAFARQRLIERYPNVRFSAEVITTPIGLSNPSLFHNQMACFQADTTIDEVKRQLKQIEYQAGRRKEDKQLEIIRLDIDLLQADNRVLKPDDMKRHYVDLNF